MSQKKKYTLDELLEGYTKPESDEDPFKDLQELESEWPAYIDPNKPLAYRVVDWRGDHIAVVFSRERAHSLKSKNFDPRFNTIYAIYPDESEKWIQIGMGILNDLNTECFEKNWAFVMRSSGVDEDEIEKTLSYYRNKQDDYDN